jgi:hypothetical protein
MKSATLSIIFLFGVFFSSQAQVGIGTTSPNSNAALEIASINKGVLIPRVSKVNRPTNPSSGLLIYQTDNIPGFYFYTADGWKRLYAVADNDTMTVNPNPDSSTDPSANPGSTGTITGADGITYTTVRLGDGSVWLQQNLGSSRVATSADDALSYGDLYQWGRWTDGHEKRTPVFSRTITANEPNPNNPDGLIKQWGVNVNPYYYQNTLNWWYYTKVFQTDLWEAVSPSVVDSINGCDPCKLLLGTTWRLPTRAEYIGISNNSSVTGIAVTNGETGFSSYLKISWAGRRDANSTSIFETENYAYLWAATSMQGTSNTSQAMSYRFSIRGNFGSSNVNNVAAGRGNGYSIRCKKD